MSPLTHFTFGDWQADVLRNQISRQDQMVQVEPKVMDLLVELASADGQPLSQSELRESLWQEVHVAEGAVKHLVWDLRRALDDDARNPAYVETIPRQGYRLVTPVEASQPEEATHEEPFGPIRRWQWAGLAATALILGLAALAVSFDKGSRADDRFSAAPRLSPLTSLPGNEIDPSISPDGRHVAFAWEGPADQFDIYVLEIGSDVPRRLTRDPAAESSPTWSPDGKTVAFRRAGPQGGLFAVPSSGGPEIALAGPEMGAVLDAVYSPKGTHVAVSVRPEEDFRLRLGLLSLQDGKLRWLTAPPRHAVGDRDPSFSPDGRTIAFRRTFFEGNDDLFTVDAASGQERRLTTEHASIIGLSYSADGDSIVFSSDRVPPRSLWRIDVDSGALTWLPSTSGFPVDPWGLDLGRLVFQTMRCDANIWALDRVDGSPASLLPAAASTRVDQFPQISPQADRVAFISDRSGWSEIWIAELGKDLPRQATSLRGPKISVLHWSPDGQQIVFDVQKEGASSLRVLDLATGEMRRLQTQGGNQAAPSWSRDGRSIYFASDRTGRWQIFKRPLEGPAIQLTQQGGFAALEGSGGDYLFYTRRDRDGLWRLPLTGASAQVEEVRLIDQPSSPDFLNWDLSDEGIYLVRASRQGRAIVRYDQQTLTPQPLLQLDQWSPYPGLTASRDGELLLFTRLDTSASDLVLMEELLP